MSFSVQTRTIIYEMKTLYLFRHGETEWNRLQRFQGHSDIALNTLGREQAQRLIAFFRSIDLDMIFSSDLLRARETAQILINELWEVQRVQGGSQKVPLFESPALREANLGLAEGLTPDQIESRFGKGLIQKWKSNLPEHRMTRYPEGETGHEVVSRMRGTLDEICRTFDFETAAVSTHGGVLRRFLASINEDAHEKVPIPNCVIYGVTYEPKTARWAFLSALPRSGC